MALAGRLQQARKVGHIFTWLGLFYLILPFAWITFIRLYHHDLLALDIFTLDPDFYPAVVILCPGILLWGVGVLIAGYRQVPLFILLIAGSLSLPLGVAAFAVIAIWLIARERRTEA